MILDASLMFFKDEPSVASKTSKVIDFGQEDPRIGMSANRFCVLFYTGEDFAATDITVTIEHSDDGESFESLDVVKTGGDVEQIVIPMALYHKRYMRVKVELTGTPAGTFSVVITDNFNDTDLPALQVE